jgi:hypothetical protein
MGRVGFRGRTRRLRMFQLDKREAAFRSPSFFDTQNSFSSFFRPLSGFTQSRTSFWKVQELLSVSSSHALWEARWPEWVDGGLSCIVQKLVAVGRHLPFEIPARIGSNWVMGWTPPDGIKSTVYQRNIRYLCGKCASGVPVVSRRDDPGQFGIPMTRASGG